MPPRLLFFFLNSLFQGRLLRHLFCPPCRHVKAERAHLIATIGQNSSSFAARVRNFERASRSNTGRRPRGEDARGEPPTAEKLLQRWISRTGFDEPKRNATLWFGWTDLGRGGKYSYSTLQAVSSYVLALGWGQRSVVVL